MKKWQYDKIRTIPVKYNRRRTAFIGVPLLICRSVQISVNSPDPAAHRQHLAVARSRPAGNYVQTRRFCCQRWLVRVTQSCCKARMVQDGTVVSSLLDQLGALQTVTNLLAVLMWVCPCL